MSESDVAVVCLSCDKYRWTWRTWHSYMQRNWFPELGWPLHLVTEYLEPQLEGVTVLKGGGGPWGLNTRRAVEQLSARTILVTLDDFWFNRQPELTLDVWRAFATISQEENCIVGVAPKCWSHPQDYKGTDKIFNGIPLEEQLSHHTWYASLQVAIWPRELFLETLIDDEDCWSFEVAGGRRLQSRGARRYSWECNWYHHTVGRGFLDPTYAAEVLQNGDTPRLA